MSRHPVVTDGGLETDLLYHYGVELPDFAAFPLVDDERGRQLLLRYYGDYVDIAKRAGAGLQLETRPTRPAQTGATGSATPSASCTGSTATP